MGEFADKPGSVVGNHSSGIIVTDNLLQPTRKRREPRQCFPIWPCSEGGLPCRSCYHERGGLLHPHFTLTPRLRTGRYLSVALSVTSRCPAVSRPSALWSPDFPRHAVTHAAIA